MAKYTVTKRDGEWWLIDADGYEVSYVGHTTKKQALEAAKIRTMEDERIERASKMGTHSTAKWGKWI